MNYTTKQLADLTNSELIGDGSLQVTTISFDSRTIYSSADNAFIAINTKINSGEKYTRVFRITMDVVKAKRKKYDSEGNEMKWGRLE